MRRQLQATTKPFLLGYFRAEAPSSTVGAISVSAQSFAAARSHPSSEFGSALRCRCPLPVLLASGTAATAAKRSGMGVAEAQIDGCLTEILEGVIDV